MHKEIHMNRSLAVVVGAVVLLGAGISLAQDVKAPPSTPPAMAPQSGKPMTMDSQMGQMDEHMQMMKTLHEKMLTATTPEARQIIADKQREEMQQCVGIMNQMHGGAMMEGMGGGMMAQQGKPVDQQTQMQMMEKRRDMMNMMMQTMMDQHGMMAGGAAPKK
jgi:hypothetical protein